MEAIGLADFKAMWAANREAYLDAVDRVGRSGWLVLGKEVSAFEEALAAQWGIPHAVGVANGLDALEIAFRIKGMKAGDRVLTTPLSAFATTLAILRVGAVPVFADVDQSGLLDLQQAETAFGTSNPPKFIVPVHLFGHAMNLDALEAFTRRHGLTLIEDCAQAIGARSAGRVVGSVGDVCATSFYPTKNLGAFGDGGALLMKTVELRDQARCLRDYGQSAKYVHDEVGLNSRLDELQAALLRSVQLPALHAQTQRRRELARRFLAELDPRVVELPVVPVASESVWHLFPVMVERREGFRAHLQSHGVSTGLHYPSLIPAQKAMREVPAVTLGSLARAQRFADHEVSLPLHPFMSDDDAARVITAVNSFKEHR